MSHQSAIPSTQSAIPSTSSAISSALSATQGTPPVILSEAKNPLHLICGDVVEVCGSLAGQKFHAVLCDPPYNLEFMGKQWDVFDNKPRAVPGTGGKQAPFANHSVADVGERSSGYQQQACAWGKALMPLLHPGALVLMFGGTRTWHRLACGMEDAGFLMWDTLMFLHGQGFPKAQDISKLIDKTNGDEREVTGPHPYSHLNGKDGCNKIYGGQTHPDSTAPATEASASWNGWKTTALKPAWEAILCFKKPLEGTYAETAMKYGSGALNVDGARIGVNPGYKYNADKNGTIFHGEQGARIKQSAEKKGQQFIESTLGRFPANLALDEEAAVMLDEQVPPSRSTGGRADNALRSDQRIYGKGKSNPEKRDPGLGDYGGPSRFFYCAKASRSERDAGLAEVSGKRDFSRSHGQAGTDNPFNRGADEVRNSHPTVKPLALCCWLATLLLPPDSVKPRRLLVPFAGSGSEMIGALQAGWDEVVGIEKEEDYCRIARQRIAFAEKKTGLFESTTEPEAVPAPAPPQLDFFEVTD